MDPGNARLDLQPLAALRVSGEIDLSNFSEVEEAIASMERGGPVLLDLSGLTFIDSMGIHALFRAAAKLGDGGCLVLHGERPNVRRVLDLVDVDRMPNLHRVHPGTDHVEPPVRAG